MTSSSQDADVKGDIFKHTIYPPNLVVIAFILRTSRFDDYGLRATVGRVLSVASATGPSTQQMVLKYKVKIEDYRQQTTNKERRQTAHYKVRLVFIFSSQKLPFEKARATLVLLFSR